MVSRVHTLLPPSYDWSGTDGKPGASEDKRERAEVQRSYYGFLNALAQNQLLQCLHVRPFTAALVSLQATNQSAADLKASFPCQAICLASSSLDMCDLVALIKS